LILNAGRGSLLLFEDVIRAGAEGMDGFRSVMEVNYWSNVNLTRYALEELKKTRGNITVISSLAGKFCFPRRTGYSPTKHALNAFFKYDDFYFVASGHAYARVKYLSVVCA
jgi:NAD(P)-dependent dehydrogenase (short-subunit alcohol dehydrogenase family)